ncbi:MAG: CoA-binding protein [Acidobacteriota bacterium]|nr:CoA-binding protein [Acidobacteriota bacterium]MDH3522413.1 CoA-binding protein [Acidobacteriota bacterium]
MSDETDIEATVRRILAAAEVVAVLGAHVEPRRPAFYVPEYLFTRGYRILPVNPAFAGRRQWGETFAGRLSELRERVDVVDVFRRSSLLPEHLEDLLAMDPAPRWVWFQLGVRHDGVATALRKKGIVVVQDRCLLADHRRFRS